MASGQWREPGRRGRGPPGTPRHSPESLRAAPSAPTRHSPLRFGSRTGVRKSTSVDLGVGRAAERASPRRAQRPELLRAERGVVDPAGVLGPAGPGRLSRTGQVQEVADLPADRPSWQAAVPGPEHQVLDILLAAAIGLQADRGDHAGLGPRGGSRPAAGRKRQLVGPPPRVAVAHGLPGKNPVGPQRPGVQAPAHRLEVRGLPASSCRRIRPRSHRGSRCRSKTSRG